MKMLDKKTLIVVPPRHRKSNAMGASAVSGRLKKRGFDSEVYDMSCLCQSYNDLEMKLEQTYDFVGISTTSVKSATKIADLAKASGAVVVAGGPLPTLLPGEFMEHVSSVDICVVGDGDDAMAEIVSGSELDTIRGISYRAPQGVVHTGRRPVGCLEDIVFDEEYREWTAENVGVFGILVGMGCGKACSFCSADRINTIKGGGGGVRLRKVKSVVSDVRRVFGYGASTIQLFLDNISVDKNYAIDLFDALASGPDVKYYFALRADDALELQDELAALSEQRVISDSLGYENGSRRMLKKLNKGITPETIEECETFHRKRKIPHNIFWINFAHPKMEWQDVEENYEFINRNELDLNYYLYSLPLTISAGSAIWRSYRRHTPPDPEADFSIPYRFEEKVQRLFEVSHLTSKFAGHLDELLRFYSFAGSKKSDPRLGFKLSRELFTSAFNAVGENQPELLRDSLVDVVETVGSFRKLPESPQDYAPFMHQYYLGNIDVLVNSTQEEMLNAVDAFMGDMVKFF